MHFQQGLNFKLNLFDRYTHNLRFFADIFSSTKYMKFSDANEYIKYVQAFEVMKAMYESV